MGLFSFCCLRMSAEFEKRFLALRSRGWGRKEILRLPPPQPHPFLPNQSKVASDAPVIQISHILVSDNSTTFFPYEFQEWRHATESTHLTEASYHKATNNAADCLILSFKPSLQKSSLPPQATLQKFCNAVLTCTIRFYLFT